MHDAPPIYLDHHATTPLDPAVGQALALAFAATRNASSRHAFGRQARGVLERAAETVASFVGGIGREILWTSGATEANNIAVLGALQDPCGAHVLVGATEHASVLAPAQELRRRGATVDTLAVCRDGRVDPHAVMRQLNADTRLVCLMLANNEIGVLHPVAEVVRRIKAERPDILVHCDAAQALAHIPICVQQLGVDFLSCSAHKVYGPCGVGALWVRNAERLRPCLFGGHQQGNLRPGTIPVALAVGFAEACRVALTVRDEEARRVAMLRDSLLCGLRSDVGGVQVTGSLEHRLPGNLNVWFEGLDARTILELCPTVAASTGAACRADGTDPSHVFGALGLPQRAMQSIRFGVGRSTTAAEIDAVVAAIGVTVEHLRALAGPRIRSRRPSNCKAS